MNPIAVKVCGWAVAWCLSLLAPEVLAQDSSGVQWTSVHGYRVGLAVQSLYDTAPPGTEPKHARALGHRMRVSIRDEATGRPVRITSATAYVSEIGHPGATVSLTPVPSAEEVEGRLTLAPRTPYRIVVQATPAGGRTLEVQFEYRHHH